MANPRPEQAQVNRYLRIGIATALMATLVFLVGTSLYEGSREAVLIPAPRETPRLSAEAGVFERSDRALAYLEAPDVGETRRSLTAYYANRAYPGAPPPIPHPLVGEGEFGAGNCLACHGEGGWVEAFDAWTPVTPHPELESCLQCHVPVATREVFRRNDFVPAAAAPIRQTAFEGGPPIIPHSLHLRENCLACHAGPGAVNELRTTHPERIGCRQCHATETAVEPVFRRPFEGGTD